MWSKGKVVPEYDMNVYDMIWYDMIWYDMIYLLTVSGLPPGGRCTIHIYTQTIHRTTQNKQYIVQHKNFENNTKILEEWMEGLLHSFLNFALYWCEWSTSHSCRFIPGISTSPQQGTKLAPEKVVRLWSKENSLDPTRNRNTNHRYSVP
jgi:hypothetical protein